MPSAPFGGPWAWEGCAPLCCAGGLPSLMQKSGKLGLGLPVSLLLLLLQAL